MATESEGIVEGRDISLTYATSEQAAVRALDRVSFKIRMGDFISLIGPSGCGKTTLLQIFGDLLTPTSGSLLVNGEPPSRLRRQRQVGQMFQEATLLPWKTIRQNIELLRLVAGKKVDRSIIENFAAIMGIEGFLEHYPHQLSGGMRQRAALARAYALEPTILLMDEPFGALDEITRSKMHDELLQIWQERRTTIIFVTHSISEAVYLSNRVFVMAPRPGRIIDDIEITVPHERRAAERYGAELSALSRRAHERLVQGMNERPA